MANKEHRIRAYYVPFFEMIGDRQHHMFDAYVPYGKFGEPVQFTDDLMAKRLELDRASIKTPKGDFTVADGLPFLENLFRMFTGNTYLSCDSVKDGTVLIAGSRPERKASRGEPKMDPMEDIDGQYRRFQQRGQEL